MEVAPTSSTSSLGSPPSFSRPNSLLLNAVAPKGPLSTYKTLHHQAYNDDVDERFARGARSAHVGAGPSEGDGVDEDAALEQLGGQPLKPHAVDVGVLSSSPSKVALVSRTLPRRLPLERKPQLRARVAPSFQAPLPDARPSGRTLSPRASRTLRRGR